MLYPQDLELCLVYIYSRYIYQEIFITLYLLQEIFINLMEQKNVSSDTIVPCIPSEQCLASSRLILVMMCYVLVILVMMCYILVMMCLLDEGRVEAWGLN
jgi:hypothetical protein